MIVRYVLVGVAVLALAGVAPRGALAWRAAVPATPLASRPFGVTVDGAGNVLAVGRAVGTSNDDAVTAKLSGADGSLQWRHTLGGSAAGSDLLRSVATDSLDGVIAGGQLVNLTTRGDLLVLKYDTAGAQAWRIELDGGAAGEDDALAVTVDADGAAVVAGQLTPMGASNTRFAVLKLAGLDGATLWRTDLPGESGSARAVVVDGDDVIAAGDADRHIVVAKLAGASGMQSWRTDAAGSTSANDIGRAVAVGSGRVVVAGRTVTAAGGPDFAVIALDAATGTEAWRAVIDGTTTGGADTDDAFGVGIDASGDVIAAGRLGNTATDGDALVVKLAGASGVELWRRTVNGSNGTDDVAQAMVLNAGGDVFVVGTIRNSVTRADVLLARFAGDTGREIWQRTVNGSENGNDAGFAAARTAGGDLVGAARVRSGSATGAFVVVKLTGANGGDFPCGDGTRDVGEACDDGNVAPGDGCRGDCTAEVCGDGILDPQEECDDGGTAAGDCCSPTCTADPDDIACDDTDACTLGDRCQHGLCVAMSLVPCEPSDACDAATCNSANGICSHVRRADGALCDDASVCTALTQCVRGTCTGRVTMSCDDGDPCTADTCAPASGCAHEPVTSFPSITCAFERPTIPSGCPAGVPNIIRSRLDRARQLVTVAGGTERPRTAWRVLGNARRALKQAARVTEARRRHGSIEPACATALADALGDILARTDTVRAPLAR